MLTLFYVGLSVWWMVVVIYAIFVVPYRELKPIDRIKRGYLTWTENHQWQMNVAFYGHGLRVGIQIRGLIRYWITGPVIYKVCMRNAWDDARDASQIYYYNKTVEIDQTKLYHP